MECHETTDEEEGDQAVSFEETQEGITTWSLAIGVW